MKTWDLSDSILSSGHRRTPVSVHPRKEAWITAYRWLWTFRDEEAGLSGVQVLSIAKSG